MLRTSPLSRSSFRSWARSARFSSEDICDRYSSCSTSVSPCGLVGLDDRGGLRFATQRDHFDVASGGKAVQRGDDRVGRVPQLFVAEGGERVENEISVGDLLGQRRPLALPPVPAAASDALRV